MTKNDSLASTWSAARSAFVSVGAFSFVINLLMLTTPLYMLQVYDRVVGSGSLPTLFYLTLIAAGALLLLGLVEVVRSRILIATSIWFEKRLAPEVLRRSVEEQAGHGAQSGESLRDLATVRNFLSGPAVTALFDAPWVPLYLGVIYLLHPLLGHVALTGAVGLLFLALATDRASHAALHQASRHAASAARTADAGVRNGEVIDAMGMMRGFMGRWAADTGRSLDLQAGASRRVAVLNALARAFRQLIQVAVLGAGAWLVVRQEVTGGIMIAASIIMGRGLAPLEQAIGSWRQAVQARDAHARLRVTMSAPAKRPSAMPLPPPRSRLDVEGVVYAPPGVQKPVIKGVSFSVHPGEALAIVGPSAAGKSTLARLLVGVFPPAAGTVRLDGADVFAWSREDIGRHVGYLPQDIEMFAGTVGDNIARLAEADPDAVVDAARLAHCHDMVLRLERGYDTQIGDGGMHLSGGQRQRLGLARALYGRPRLVVLDEPNSSLDSEGEAALSRAIAALKADGAAVVVIGHRPSILRHIDRVLVLVDGRIERIGPRDEIMPGLTRPRIRPGRSAGAETAPVPAE